MPRMPCCDLQTHVSCVGYIRLISNLCTAHGNQNGWLRGNQLLSTQITYQLSNLLISLWSQWIIKFTENNSVCNSEAATHLATFGLYFLVLLKRTFKLDIILNADGCNYFCAWHSYSAIQTLNLTWLGHSSSTFGNTSLEWLTWCVHQT